MTDEGLIFKTAPDRIVLPGRKMLPIVQIFLKLFALIGGQVLPLTEKLSIKFALLRRHTIQLIHPLPDSLLFFRRQRLPFSDIFSAFFPVLEGTGPATAGNFDRGNRVCRDAPLVGFCNGLKTRQGRAADEGPECNPRADCNKTRPLCRLPQSNISIENNGL